jgi:hypothetical protein
MKNFYVSETHKAHRNVFCSQNVECLDVKPGGTQGNPRLAVATLQRLYALQERCISRGSRPFHKWSVEPLVTYNINTSNILIFGFINRLWHVAKLLVPEWPAVKEDCALPIYKKL